ncbi:MAG: hypothetical protein WCM93_16825, partial [Bacteroidota bacterium]
GDTKLEIYDIGFPLSREAADKWLTYFNQNWSSSLDNQTWNNCSDNNLKYIKVSSNEIVVLDGVLDEIEHYYNKMVSTAGKSCGSRTAFLLMPDSVPENLGQHS